MSKAFNYGHYHNMGPSRINCYLGEIARDKFELLYIMCIKTRNKLIILSSIMTK